MYSCVIIILEECLAKLVIILLMNRCGHCQRLKPTWQELGSSIQSSSDEKVIIAEVDCTTATKLCSEQDVTGYPT